MKAKAAREEADTQHRISANRDMLEVLNQQVAALESKKQEEIILREEEAKLLVSDKKLHESPFNYQGKLFLWRNMI